ncbi:winged helix-turn-helix domain-containing protein [Paenibacillus solisilvae]|uniref:Winged helix-turn-helix domain-containing protein n=1 Tax=Paenibacillus solisilvae TaxID=2486751 RepID=A0ABW0VXN1_9BACL
MAARMVTNEQAKNFLLAHHGLLTANRFEGKAGILAYVERVGCLQFDPLNVVGYNQELVLQSRIPGFRSEMLNELLYTDRVLVDGWDKNMSIYRREDWPYFTRLRRAAAARLEAMPHVNEIVPQVIETLSAGGPLSSGGLDYNQVVDWSWAPTRLSRAVLESLYFTGDLIVHHKDRTRKVYDLSNRHLPAELLLAADPNLAEEAYWEWYVLRRMGGIGFLWNMSGDAWLGISGMKSKERTHAIAQLQDKGKIVPLQVEGIQKQLYMRAADLPLLTKVLREDYSYPSRAFILAPLDNLIWDRRLIKELFDFDYRWEVYKPLQERQYGYYVLPVMCGNRFAARFEPGLDKKKKELVIKNWWWEPGITVSAQMVERLSEGFRQFMDFLGVKSVRLEAVFSPEQQEDLTWLAALSSE